MTSSNALLNPLGIRLPIVQAQIAAARPTIVTRSRWHTLSHVKPYTLGCPRWPEPSADRCRRLAHGDCRRRYAFEILDGLDRVQQRVTSDG